MDWKGQWRNQYGSIVTITDDANERISGTFKTALKDSGFYGQEIPVVGIHQGDCIIFAGAGRTAAGDAAVSYTGLLRDGKIETMWFVVADSAIKAPSEGAPGKREKLNWWRSISTSADTFERI
jgi:hypothetical protein